MDKYSVEDCGDAEAYEAYCEIMAEKEADADSTADGVEETAA